MPDQTPLSPPPPPPPSSILIIGAGVFGLSTTHALLSSPRYAQTAITLIDSYIPPPSTPSSSLSPHEQDNAKQYPHLTASLDSSRIIRSDYASGAYTRLARDAQELWRKGWPWGCDGDGDGPGATDRGKKRVYFETGFVLTATRQEGVSEAEVRRGREYVRGSLENVRGVSEVDVLGSGGEVRRCFFGGVGEKGKGKVEGEGEKVGGEKVGGEEGGEGMGEEGVGWAWGDGGYVNWGSGWADATGAMEGLRGRVWELGLERKREGNGKEEGKGEFKWIGGKVERLDVGPAVKGSSRGVILEGGERLEASLIIIAAGAWSAALMPKLLGPRLRANGQAVAYVKLNAEEARRYRGKPVLMDLTTAMFIMSPPPLERGENGKTEVEHGEAVLKVARHGYGYQYRTVAQDPISKEGCEIFVPAPDFESLPEEGEAVCRKFLKAVDPALGSKPWCQTRICNYTDTPSGDFLIDWVPGYHGSILVASGGSGHGFKFVPIIGEKIVSKIEAQLGAVHGSLDSELENLWRWRPDEEVENSWAGERDGSRGGPQDMSWEEEMRKQ